MGIPGTESKENPRGTMVEVFWDQDDYGTLCISGHSDETPIPPNIEPIPIISPLAESSPWNFSGQGGLVVRGVVLDHNKIKINRSSQQ